MFCSPLVDDRGEVVQASEVRRDVTVRASLEANLRHSERLASLGLLASGISHELNNPLAPIAACADGLFRQVQQGCCDTPEGRATVLEYLDLVKRETMRAKAITERLLILARPPSGRAEVVEMNRVVDNNPGIEPGDTKKIFEPFYARRPDGQGTGLGLFIAQTIARGLHGTIRVSSRVGEGAAFVVEVPIHGAPGGAPHRR